MPKIDFLLRRIFDTTFRLIRHAEIAIKPKKKIKNLVHFPLIKNKENLADLLNRVNWYFPEQSFSNATITFPVESNLYDSVKDFSKIKAPSNQENFIKKNSRIKFVKILNSMEASRLATKSDGILLWDFTSFYQVPMGIFNLNKIWVIDPNYFLVTEARNYIRLLNATIPDKKLDELLLLGFKNFETMIGKVKKFDNAYVFGTGPSITQASKFNFSDGFRIIANTVLNDPKLAKHINAHAVIFGDFVYHIGPSKYAAKFMKQMVNAAEKGMYGLIRFDILPLMVSHYPKLKNKFVAIPMKLFAKPNIPSKEKYYLNLSNNSLVGYMLPISSAAVNNIYILGCDGRKPNDKLFWSHAKTTYFDDMLSLLMQTHPSVFRDTDYKEFFDGNSRDTEEFISYGESFGKKYFSLAPSYIPALAKRQK